jgi:ADP-ribosylglycohydrolase
MAVAVAAALAAHTTHPAGREFLRETLTFIPESTTRRKIQLAMEIPADQFQVAAQKLGTGRAVSAQDTVPFCLWNAAYHLEDFAEALWWTVRGLGDRDTTCAIVGGIVALSAPEIPAAWLKRREGLPVW